MEPVLKRVLEHLESTKEFFLNFLPNSTNPCNKKAVNTESYKVIVSLLKPANIAKTVCCAKFALFMAKQNKTFLTQLQHQTPMIHKLYELCVQLVQKFMNLIVKSDKITNNGESLKALNMDDKDNLLPASSCNFGEGVKNMKDKLKAEERPKVL